MIPYLLIFLLLYPLVLVRLIYFLAQGKAMLPRGWRLTAACFTVGLLPVLGMSFGLAEALYSLGPSSTASETVNFKHALVAVLGLNILYVAARSKPAPHPIVELIVQVVLVTAALLNVALFGLSYLAPNSGGWPSVLYLPYLGIALEIVLLWLSSQRMIHGSTSTRRLTSSTLDDFLTYTENESIETGRHVVYVQSTLAARFFARSLPTQCGLLVLTAIFVLAILYHVLYLL